MSIRWYCFKRHCCPNDTVWIANDAIAGGGLCCEDGEHISLDSDNKGHCCKTGNSWVGDGTTGTCCPDGQISGNKCCPEGQASAGGGECCPIGRPHRVVSAIDGTSENGGCCQNESDTFVVGETCCPSSEPHWVVTEDHEHNIHGLCCPNASDVVSHEHCCQSDAPNWVTSAGGSRCCPNVTDSVSDGHCCPIARPFWGVRAIDGDSENGGCCPNSGDTFVGDDIGCCPSDKPHWIAAAGNEGQCCPNANDIISNGHCCPTEAPEYNSTADACCNANGTNSDACCKAIHGALYRLNENNECVPSCDESKWASEGNSGAGECCASDVDVNQSTNLCCTSNAPTYNTTANACCDSEGLISESCCIALHNGEDYEYFQISGTAHCEPACNKCEKRDDTDGVSCVIDLSKTETVEECCSMARGGEGYWAPNEPSGSKCCDAEHTASNGRCCPLDAPNWIASGNTCCPNADDIVSSGHCCPLDALNWLSADNICCPNANDVVSNGHCCPTAKPIWNEDLSIATGGLCCTPYEAVIAGQCEQVCSALTNEQCSSNDDCCSEDDFCAFEAPVSKTNKGNGKCVPIDTYNSDLRIVKNLEFMRSTTQYKMNFWTAENWCLAQGYAMSSRTEIGCALVPGGKYCTEPTGSSTPGYAYSGSPLLSKERYR